MLMFLSKFCQKLKWKSRRIFFPNQPLITWTIFILLVLTVVSLNSCSRSPRGDSAPLKIGVLIMGDSRTAKFEGLRQGLSELGLTESEVKYTLFNAHDDEKKLETCAQELIGQKPDILVAAGGIEAEVLARNLKGRPIVPVVLIGVTSAKNLQALFIDQGIPVTGVDNGHIELTGKRMELLRLLFPKRTKLLLVYDPRLSASNLALQEAQEVVRAYSYTTESIPVSVEKDLLQLKKRSFSPQEALLILPSYYLESIFREIRTLSLRERIPVMGLYDTEVEAGYTASYGIPYWDQGYQAARLVMRMAQEKRSIPFEMPDSVYLKLNMKAVEQIGENVSPAGLNFGEKIYTIRE